MSDQWTTRLSEYLDDELSEGERITLEAHLQSCQECPALLLELRQVVYRARTLKNDGPPRDLWPDIAERIGVAPATTHSVDLASRRSRRWSFSLPQLAAAGVALMTLSGGTVWLLRTPAQQSVTPVVTTVPSGNPQAINTTASWRGSADSSYATAVADLEGVLATSRGQLDSTTILVIEQNLAAIDRAIAQAQAALKDDPANLYLNSHLNETRRRKLELLRQAATLVPVS
jgi:anti-sigma factor RsiW